MSDCCVRDRPGANYDLVVVGAGSAGFSAAITAAEQGAQVALVGHGTIGGTCVNIGCVPSKALIRAVEAVHHANAASVRFEGLESQARVVDWAEQVAQKDALVSHLRQKKYADLLPCPCSKFNLARLRAGTSSGPPRRS
jgi:mercuric reductase